MSEDKSFEQQLQTVQETVEAISSGKLPLEDSVKEYEKGIAILDKLEKSLEDLKRRVVVVRDSVADEPFAEINKDEDV